MYYIFMLKNVESIVFDCDDIKRKIFHYLPLNCKSCKHKMNRKFVNSSIHLYRDKQWCYTENEYCRGYCNWCCIYVFNHQR